MTAFVTLLHFFTQWKGMETSQPSFFMFELKSSSWQSRGSVTTDCIYINRSVFCNHVKNSHLKMCFCCGLMWFCIFSSTQLWWDLKPQPLNFLQIAHALSMCHSVPHKLLFLIFGIFIGSMNTKALTIAFSCVYCIFPKNFKPEVTWEGGALFYSLLLEV